jgi:endonuclease YncB( thermonuclease family)
VKGFGRAARRTGAWRSTFRADLAAALFIFAALTVGVDRLNRPETYDRAGAVSVHDGDTLTLEGEKIRLLDIDAPELRQTCRLGRRSYACGESSRDALIALIGRNPVRCEASRRDRYRRLLGECTAGGRNLNVAQVEQGWAVAYGGKLKAEEEGARRRKAGIWAGTFENPKEYRQKRGFAGDIEFGAVAELGVRFGEALGFISAADWQSQDDASE